MSIANFYDDLCDIYRYIETNNSKGWGQNEDVFDYETTPRGVDIKCHFNANGKGSSTSQSEPDNQLIINQVLVMAIGEDIEIGDKIVNKINDLEFTVSFIDNIRNNHLKVNIYRTVQQVSL